MKIITVIAFGMLISSFAVANTSKTVTGIQYSADKIIQDEKVDSIQLIGHAKVTQGDKTVTGEKIALNLKTGSVVVTGDAKYSAKSMTVQLTQ